MFTVTARWRTDYRRDKNAPKEKMQEPLALGMGRGIMIEVIV